MNANDEENPDEGLGRDVFALVEPPPRTYDGWHLPRKQVVRHAQWSGPLRDILRERRDPPDAIRYLGLPGRDLLDVRHLLDTVCQPDDLKIEFLGFDRAAGSSEPDNPLLNSAYADLIRSPHVVGTSVIAYDDINRIADMNSQAFVEARDRAPFDVINLDFCEAVVGRANSVYPLLKRLLTIQKTHADWLLLLTSFVDRDSFADDSLAKLLPLLEEGRANCEGFEEAIAEYLELPDGVTADQARSLSAQDFFILAGVLVGKWLLKETLKTNSKLKVVSACGYSVYNAEHMDMMSLSIRVRPIYATPGDAAGLVPADQIDECDETLAMLHDVVKIQNIDEYLASDPARAERYVRESIELVRLANHPLPPYYEFLRSKNIAVPEPIE